MTTTINASTTGGGGLIESADASGILALQTNGITAVTIDASQKVTFAQPIQGGSITSSTAVASTSGTSIDFTGIPSWAKRITVMFNGVSTSGTSPVQIQLGNGTIVTTGYVSGSSGAAVATPNLTNGTTSTTGFVIFATIATDSVYGVMTIQNISANTWIASHSVYVATGQQVCSNGAGFLSLSGTLDRVRITTVNGTDTFDAGSINIMYEG